MIWINLAATLVAVVLTMAATMAYALRTNNQSIVDSVWGLGFVVVAIVSFVLSLASGEGNLARSLLALVLTAIWGVRLGAYIHHRNRGKGEDPRYAAMLRQNTGPVVPFVLRKIYLPQGAVMWFVSLPVQIAMFQPQPLNVFTWLGVAFWIVGFAFEAIGDAQLARFKADPANEGRVMDQGLWAWTRHPNYFGDAAVWWGLFLIALGTPWALVTIVCPWLMTYLLISKSGKALTEKRMAKSKGQEYVDYVNRTSGFFPLPPRQRS
ncbi:DUF1295 domain-containing protein [Herbidospora solisilvae]|nr:DUF1295 domain-containing protein [Herbidospora solisilvae]